MEELRTEPSVPSHCPQSSETWTLHFFGKSYGMPNTRAYSARCDPSGLDTEDSFPPPICKQEGERSYLGSIGDEGGSLKQNDLSLNNILTRSKTIALIMNNQVEPNITTSHAESLVGLLAR